MRNDVVRSGVADDTNELPESGYAKNIMSQFSSMEEQIKSVSQHTPSGVGSKVWFMFHTMVTFYTDIHYYANLSIHDIS